MRPFVSLLALALGACDAGPPGDDGGPDAEVVTCPAFGSGVVAGTIASDELRELSGLAASRRDDDLFYAHNDSGDAPRVFLLDGRGTHLGVVALEGAEARDWEDIAVGPGPGEGSFVYVGDVGDNAARMGVGTPRESVTVYRFAEPAFERGAPVTLATIADAFVFTYPDGPRDCEALAVDPSTADLYFLAKEDGDDPTLYVARAPIASGELERVTTVTLRLSVTAMDLSPSGRGLLVRTYTSVRLWLREPGEGWAEALARPSLRAPSSVEAQGEAIAWHRDGRSYFTSSEGLAAPLHRFDSVVGCDPP